MKPGRELDNLIATKIMGWHIEVYDGSNLWFSSDTPSGWIGKHADGLSQWSPSTDIAAAWEVVEKIQQMNDEDIFTDFHEHLNGLDLLIGMPAKEATHAICLAALKAVGVDIDAE